MPPLVIYITGFRQHAGKTVTSIGLISQLRKFIDPSRIGYIKPVGQELVELEDGSKVDKDAKIIEKFSRIPDINMEYISPVRVGSGFTKYYLTSQNKAQLTEDLKGDIFRSMESLKHKDIIIAEGTGHPGVGGIVGLSNAEVSNLIGADIIFLSGGGIGKALDMLEVDLSYFMYKKSRVRGIIFNKLIPSKIDTVKLYITEDLLNSRYHFDDPLRIFGFLPEVEDLPRPSMNVVREIFTGSCILGDPDEESWQQPCRKIRVISLSEEHLRLERYIDSGDLVVIGSGSARRISRILEYNETLEKKLSGLILTCGTESDPNEDLHNRIADAGLPAMVVQEDTATAEEMILNCYENTKLQVYDAHKITEIEDLFEKHFDLGKFLDTFGIRR